MTYQSPSSDVSFYYWALQFTFLTGPVPKINEANCGPCRCFGQSTSHLMHDQQQHYYG
ncbi:tubulin alpha-3 chain-like [Iris pallida]|uniref:Tubulin alpha-3 chain-like n=1 Tax=Iris pallida TaxID=29817 RepID=A0AAX6ESA8_IRIPA|nr:tubulin alpha-3 chain-like [Iris pallida]KAJ6806719.1 tubulin alpha-3 chain-like [Iris pallida]